MSYLTYAFLTEDVDFGRRSRSCIAQQANIFKDDGRADLSALAYSLIRGENVQQLVNMLNAIAYGPGFDTTVDNGDGTINSAKVSDGDILAQCQAAWPVIADLYYDSDGTPKP